jgi:hypothetical protein
LKALLGTQTTERRQGTVNCADPSGDAVAVLLG